MSDHPTMLSAVHYVRDLHEQSALLLRAGDTLLTDHNFAPWSGMGNTCVWESGGTHIEPWRWMPSEVVRYYKSERYQRVLFFVSILFWDRHREYDPPLSDCLLTAGAAIFNTRSWTEQDWSRNWWGRFHGYVHNRHTDGTLEENAVSAWDDKEKYPKLDRVVTVGRPLCQVTDVTILKTTLQPLFERIEGTLRSE